VSVHVDSGEWERWEAERERANREYADSERDRKRRLLPADVELLKDRVQELELKLYLTEEALRAALLRP
jgi:hypothetical protein